MTGEYTEKRKTALITGVTGQDGSYLAEYLLAKGYEVHGLVRRLSRPNLDNLAGVRDNIVLHDGDLTDQVSLDAAVRESRPDEVYNLASQSFVGSSWKQPVLTLEITGLGVVKMLEAVRRFADRARFYQASSSEMFGGSPPPQNEDTPFRPRSPYAAAKVLAHNSVGLYRESYGMFACCGILFNHESERRGIEFVTRKITTWAASVAARHPYRLELGDPDARRDWGYAPDYVDLMWRMLQYDRRPVDAVGATGASHSVLDFLNLACDSARIGRPGATGLVSFRQGAHMRPADVPDLTGDPKRALDLFGWKPTVGFEEMVRRMVASDYAKIAGRPPLFGAPP